MTTSIEHDSIPHVVVDVDIVSMSAPCGRNTVTTLLLFCLQLFYFSLFVAIFAVTNSLDQFRTAVHRLWHEKLIAIFMVGMCVLIVKWNTLVHPYLLADNRHYTFYVWNRTYGRFAWFRYAITPAYLLAFALLAAGMRHMRSTFMVMFAVAVIIVLCFQRLLEVRYFLTPFVLFRLNTLPSTGRRSGRLLEWLELGFYMVVNAATFYVFLRKEIRWPGSVF